jgi:hypothetical protein
MKSHRHRFQYSLRSFLVVLTAAAVWLGVVVNRAREQREAVRAIEASGGTVLYDWSNEIPPGTFLIYPPPVDEKPRGPAWLRRIIGDDFFQEVRTVKLLHAADSTILEIIPSLKRLRKLDAVWINDTVSKETKTTLWASLPNFHVPVAARPTSPAAKRQLK